MAIVSVAIVLSFHLKLEPTPLGTVTSQICASAMQFAHLGCRETIRVAIRNYLLVAGHGVHAVRAIELHQYGVAV